jgi:hypothetical protein
MKEIKTVIKSILVKTAVKLLAPVIREVMKEELEWIKTIRQSGIDVQGLKRIKK